MVEVLNTERQRIQAQIGVLIAQAQLTNDYVALQKAWASAGSDAVRIWMNCRFETLAAASTLIVPFRKIDL